jgi:RNA polymerase sigma factor (sigma-70 family)
MAIDWVDRYKLKITRYIRKHYFLTYSSYEIEDYLSEAYIAAYEAIELCNGNPFDAFFWMKFRHYCHELSKNPNDSMISGEIDNIPCDFNHYDSPLEIDQKFYFEIVCKMLDFLTPSQQQVIRLIAFAKTPLSVNTLASSIGVSPQAIEQRIQYSLDKIKRLRSKHFLSEEQL